MATPLLQQFPSLASYPPAFLKDLLSSPELTEAFLYSLPEVQQLAAEVERLGRENDEVARRYPGPRPPSPIPTTLAAGAIIGCSGCTGTACRGGTRIHDRVMTDTPRAGQNLALRDELVALREATAQSYNHAEALKAQWTEIDKAQTNLYQVG